MPFKIVRNDITKMKVDAIVNTANREPIYGDGVDYAVYKAAGKKKLLAFRKEIGNLEEGEVIVTPGFKLPAKYIIHAVSPYYKDGKSGEEELLRACYRKSLNLALECECESIAFPLISTGSFGYPKEEGMRIAVDEITAFLMQHEMMVYLVVFDTLSTKLGRSLYPDLEAYIDQNYVSARKEEEYRGRYQLTPKRPKPTERPERMVSTAWFEESMCDESLCGGAAPDDDDLDEFFWEKDNALEERIQHLSDTFQQYLLYLIETKGMTNAEVYNRAIISKQLFSKIKLNPNYHPDKGTALRLCIGARLNLDETKDLLARAGYALSPCDKRDVIFRYFIEKGIGDMYDIDIVLGEYGLQCFIE